MTPEMFAASTVVVNGRAFTTTSMGAVYEGRIEVNAGAKPKRFDLTFTEGAEKGRTSLGIYELDGETWKICLTTTGTVRPTQFKTAAGSGLALETLTRKKRVGRKAPIGSARAASPQAAKETRTAAPAERETEIAGEWSMVSHVNDGTPLDDSFVKFCRRVTIGDKTTVFAAERVMMSARFTHDPSASPKRIDYLKGTTAKPAQYGIYDLDGDRLRICMAAPGRPRPTDFSTAAGDKKLLTVWNRNRE